MTFDYDLITVGARLSLPRPGWP